MLIPCGAGFRGLFSAQNTSLRCRTRLWRVRIRVMQTFLGWTPSKHQNRHRDQQDVAVPVLAPWRAIYWELVMRGSFAVWEPPGEIAAHCNPSLPESRDVLIKVNRAQTARRNCETPPQRVYGIAPASQGHQQQNPRPAGPKQRSRPTPPKRNPRTGSPGRPTRHETHAVGPHTGTHRP